MKEGAKPKRRRKTNHPVLDERWGEEVGAPPHNPLRQEEEERLKPSSGSREHYQLGG